MSQQCKTVLIFNARKKLVCICASGYEAAKITHCRVGNVSRVCTGELISNGNLYFRYIPNDITVTILDLNRLNLEDYDKICGVDRKVYKTQCMNRKKWKYNKDKTYAAIESSVIHNQRYIVQVRFKGRIIQKYAPLEGKTPTVQELENKLKELGNPSNSQVVLKEYEKVVNIVALQYSNDGYY